MVLEKLSLDPVIVGTLSVVAVAVLWLMGVRGADLAAAGILIVGVMTPVSYTHLTLPTICSV